MSNLRKLSNFRQLSLSSETPTQEKRRKSLRKQFSEDLPDLKDNWLDPSVCIKIAMNSKGRRNIDRPPPIKIAWEENTKNFKTEEAVIIKKCSELKRPVSKLVRHSSLENDSILYTKPKLVEMLQNPEQDNEKPNLSIFLAYNAQETQEAEKSRPKIIAPLFPIDTKNVLQIRKTKPKINLNEIAYSPTRTDARPKLKKEETIVENNLPVPNALEEVKTTIKVEPETLEPKAINNVIIRPITAASRREKFQKRTNSAFTSITKENPAPSRPPLIRSSSAPCKSDQSKSKFLATKRKLKSAKRNQFKSPTILDEEFENANEDLKSQKALNRSVSTNGSDIVTMVSLVSPDGSDVEEIEEEIREKEKTKPIISPNRTAKENNLPKNLSLRKTVKSVSFQQSSIHSIRSFSASFPARRGSVATSLMLNPSKVGQNSQKVNEKRATNSTTPDDDEQVPKRRLIRSQSAKSEPMDNSADNKYIMSIPQSQEEISKETEISVNLKATELNSEETESSEDSGISEDIKLQESTEKDKGNEEQEKEAGDGEPKFESAKEKQCWDMFCKMSGKGINVSYDTILRGILTPTEYRISRKGSIVASFDKDSVP